MPVLTTDHLHSTRPRAILLDWGDTLMRVFPDFQGPVAGWPRVEAVAGAKAALEILQSAYTLAVTTNAVDSDASSVRDALQRAGLSQYISAVFTARELRITKPSPAYFRAALAALGCPPSQAVMVGDSYSVDVIGAQQAGLRTIWYNPGLKAVPSLPPEQDGELAHLEDLPGLLADLHLPNVAACRAWQAAEDMPDNIAAHSNVVAGAAYHLAVWLRQAGQTVDPLLAHRGGLLHDLDKFKTLRQGSRHGELSYELLKAGGQPELAEIARRHNLHTIFDPLNGPQTWEQKLVFYADKLVEGARLVLLADRFEALMLRYPAYASEIERAAPHVYALETVLCGWLGKSPAALLLELYQLNETNV